MVSNNQHKFKVKAQASGEPKKQVICKSSDVSLNYSRTLGESGHWVGAGYMHKSGDEMDHVEIKFPFYSLVYLVSGSGTFVNAAGKSTTLLKGSIFQRHPGIIHSSLVDPSSSWKEYYLDCNTELYQHLCDMSLIDKNKQIYRQITDDNRANEIEVLMSLLQTLPEDTVFDAYLKFLEILRLMFSTGTTSSVHNEMIEKSLADFDAAYRTRFDLNDYCKRQGWGYEKFRKAFKKDTGVSPKDYIIRRRMDEACRLLRTSRLQISEISENLGYASQYEFSNQFKKHFNVFPKHYRDGV